MCDFGRSLAMADKAISLDQSDYNIEAQLDVFRRPPLAEKAGCVKQDRSRSLWPPPWVDTVESV